MVLPASGGPVHRYIETSPECWAAYGRVLARQYSDPQLMALVHRLTADTYASQHPRDQPAQSLAVHLYGLFASLELGLEPDGVTAGTDLLVASAAAYPEVSAPSNPGAITVADIPVEGPNAAHIAAVRSWAESVWETWADRHEEVRDLQVGIERRPGGRSLRKNRRRRVGPTG